MPGAIAREGAPGAELGGELERRPAGAARDASRNRGRIAGDREVEVDDRARHEGVAHGAAHDPCVARALARERPGGHLDRLGAGERLRDRGHREPTSSRGTRAEIPQVTS